MQKIRAVIILMFILTNFLALQPVFAKDCKSGNIDVTQNENVCNPSPFFIDFGSDSENTFQGLLTRVIEALLGIVGLVAMFFIVVGGYQYITSRGNEEQAETGKRTLSNAIIGLVLVILAYLIVVVVIKALQGDY